MKRFDEGNEEDEENKVVGDWPSALDGAKFLDLMGNEIPAPTTEDGKLRLDDSPVYAVCAARNACD